MSRPPPEPSSAPFEANVVICNLEASLTVTPSSQVLSGIPWDGPPLDPQVLKARVMLAWLW